MGEEEGAVEVKLGYWERDKKNIGKGKKKGEVDNERGNLKLERGNERTELKGR